VTLRDWLASGWLTSQTASPEEIGNLLALADRDLQDCRTPDLSPDWRLNIAYNAALQLATAALLACGYRASREAHHYRVLPSLALTIGAERALVRQLDLFRRKRHKGGYQKAGLTSDQEAAEMAELAEALRERVTDWLRANHPDLI